MVQKNSHNDASSNTKIEKKRIERFSYQGHKLPKLLSNLVSKN